MRVIADTVQYQGFWGSFADLVWWFLSLLVIFAYIFAIFAIITDLFRDHKLNGWWKAVWIVFLVFVPILTVIVYLIARGSGMSKRSVEAAKEYQTAQDDYIKNVAGTSPSEEIAKAKALLDAGTITAEEYEALKARALA